jgi:hypothetical protein
VFASVAPLRETASADFEFTLSLAASLLVLAAVFEVLVLGVASALLLEHPESAATEIIATAPKVKIFLNIYTSSDYYDTIIKLSAKEKISNHGFE